MIASGYRDGQRGQKARNRVVFSDARPAFGECSRPLVSRGAQSPEAARQAKRNSGPWQDREGQLRAHVCLSAFGRGRLTNIDCATASPGKNRVPYEDKDRRGGKEERRPNV